MLEVDCRLFINKIERDSQRRIIRTLQKLMARLQEVELSTTAANDFQMSN